MSLIAYALWKSYDSVQALVNVDLKIDSGEFVTLLGPSGCGKTTLLRIIAGLEKPDNGVMLLSGNYIHDLPASKRPINTVFQSYALFPHLTVLGNVAYGLLARRVPKTEAVERSRHALDMVRLQGFDDRFPHQMSGGQRQRVAIARALVNEPALLLLDEPMSALDAKLRLQVQIELRELQQRIGKTFVMVTHDQQEALAVSDRIAVMEAGAIRQFGPAREVFDRPRTRFVADFLGTENFLDAEKTGDHTVHTRLGDVTLSSAIPWQKGCITVRPENMRLAEHGFEALVRASLYRGPYQILLLDGGLRMQIDANVAVRAGDFIRWTCAPESWVVLHG
jgi:spermidine/putrescine transport system ATP-binding protein